MQFKSFLSLASLAMVSVVQGIAIMPRAAQDVWSPTIITPDGTTVWPIGSCQQVTWDTSNAPVNISNGAGVQLINQGRTTFQWLAKDFSLRAGSVEVTIPSVTTGTYTITLFGDSGNSSPEFQIVDPTSK